jgi:membrane protein implicated in regulation of membrane protease activity
METYLWWAIAAMLLIIAELVTGTFYLLVIGLAGLAGAGAAYLNLSPWLQAVAAAAVATVGVVLVTRYRPAPSKSGGAALDVGQSVVLDSWVSEKDRLARVRYRNALWDARVVDGPATGAGQVLYIQNVDGNTLYVSSTRPA